MTDDQKDDGVGAIERADFVAARGESLGPEGQDRVSYLELYRDPATGTVSVIAVRQRADGTEYEASWTTAEGRVPSWAWQWVKKVGMR